MSAYKGGSLGGVGGGRTETHVFSGGTNFQGEISPLPPVKIVVPLLNLPIPFKQPVPLLFMEIFMHTP